MTTLKPLLTAILQLSGALHRRSRRYSFQGGNALRFAAALIVCVTLLSPAHAKEAQESRVFDLLKKSDYDQAVKVAAGAHNSLLYKYAQWAAIHAPDAPLDFDLLRDFIEENPDWPDNDMLIRRAEIALLISDVNREDMRAWFKRHPAVTDLGKVAAADLQKEGGTIPTSLIRQGWVEGDFSEDREKAFLKDYSLLLRQQDDMARASRLVWENKFSAVKRMMNRLSAPFQHLIKTRIELRTNARTAPYSVARVAKHYASDPGLLYDRIQWRSARDDRDGVRELLLLAPDNVPYPEKWWPLRERAARVAIEDRNYKLARRLIAKHGLKEEGVALQDALWLSGWLYLQFENKPEKAYKEFQALYHAVHYPHSKARAAYWVARAAQKSGKNEQAKGFYREAAAYSPTFYGQLAHYELEKHAPLKLPKDEVPSASQKNRLRQNELARVALMLAHMDQADRAKPFLIALADRAGNAAEARLVADLGKEMERNDLMVMAAKWAFQNGYMATSDAYPMQDIPFKTDVEKALILGLSRQESQMYPRAVSPTGAIGLMQLMPRTAKEIAKKYDMPFSAASLYEPTYNMRLGSLYLAKLLDKFDGSYVLAITAYNAGPARVDGWTRRFGMPGKTYRQTVDWIEKIPFSETRTYVQRVLENTQVYRQLLKPDSGFELQGDLEY